MTLTAIYKTLTTPEFKELSCTFCDRAISGDTTFADHLATVHLSQFSANIVKLLKDCDDKIFSVGSELKQLYICLVLLMCTCSLSAWKLISFTCLIISLPFVHPSPVLLSPLTPLFISHIIILCCLSLLPFYFYITSGHINEVYFNLYIRVIVNKLLLKLLMGQNRAYKIRMSCTYTLHHNIYIQCMDYVLVMSRPLSMVPQ